MFLSLIAKHNSKVSKKMKSIIEEASSIAKAIENGWIKAGKPQEFSIKIFEEPEKNFFGMIKRSAKVGIFYSDKIDLTKQKLAPTAHAPRNPTTRPTQSKTLASISKAIEPKAPERNISRQPVERLGQERSATQELIWTPEMIAHVNNWLKQILEIMKSPAQFSINAERFHLKVLFDRSFFEDKSREKQFFSGLSILLFQILKITYRRPLKGFKILFMTNLPEAITS
jgi:predicted RNA-binding protein Jag